MHPDYYPEFTVGDIVCNGDRSNIFKITLVAIDPEHNAHWVYFDEKNNSYGTLGLIRYVELKKEDYFYVEIQMSYGWEKEIFEGETQLHTTLDDALSLIKRMKKHMKKKNGYVPFIFRVCKFPNVVVWSESL